MEKYKKSHTKTLYPKYQLQHKTTIYLADHILNQIFKIILSIIKKHKTLTDNPK